MLRVLLTGGGTGGHIYPLIAVSNEVREFCNEQGIPLDIRYFGGASGFKQTLIGSNIAFVGIAESKWRRYFSIANFFDIFKFGYGIIQALWNVFWFMPDVAFSKGGPGVVPILLVCKFYAIPIVIHESDSIPGIANVISGKLAKKIFIGFASAFDYFPKKDVVLSGDPIRPDLLLREFQQSDDGMMRQAKRNFGFSDSIPLLVILGGSQGMSVINDFILENLQFLVRDFQILHQVGDRNYENYKKEYEFTTKEWSELEKKRYQFKAYFDEDLFDAYVGADLLLARAGATTIFEIAYFGKPAVLIPLPSAARNHQRENAYQYAKSGAAVVVEQENFLGRLIIEELEKLIQDQAKLKKMSDAAKSFYRPEAVHVITEGILNAAAKH